MAVELKLEDAQATASKVYLRGIIGGPPGAGKSWTSLTLMEEFAAREGSFVGVIESERGRSTHYADRFPHKVVVLPDQSVETYLAALALMYRQGCKALIIDSLTHAWEGGVKDAVEKAKPSMGNNQWSAWSVGKAKQRQLIDAIMRYPGFVICTCRMKVATEIAQEGPKKGKPVEVGMRFVQEEGIAYEFDWAATMQQAVGSPQDHELTIIKSVLGSYLPVGATTTNPGPELAEAIFKWLDRGGAKHADPGATQPTTRPAPVAQPAPVTSPRSHFEEEELADANFEYTISDEDAAEGDAPQANGTGGPPPFEQPAPRPKPTAPKPTGKPWNVPAAQEKDKVPATEQQLVSLGKLGMALGYSGDVPSPLTNGQARVLISRMSGEYQTLRRNGDLGSGGGPGINQRAAAERAEQSQSHPAAAAATATRDYPDDPFDDGDA